VSGGAAIVMAVAMSPRPSTKIEQDLKIKKRLTGLRRSNKTRASRRSDNAAAAKEQKMTGLTGLKKINRIKTNQ
jgi:hypothetical protein